MCGQLYQLDSHSTSEPVEREGGRGDRERGGGKGAQRGEERETQRESRRERKDRDRGMDKKHVVHVVPSVCVWGGRGDEIKIVKK